MLQSHSTEPNHTQRRSITHSRTLYKILYTNTVASSSRIGVGAIWFSFIRNRCAHTRTHRRAKEIETERHKQARGSILVQFMSFIRATLSPIQGRQRTWVCATQTSYDDRRAPILTNANRAVFLRSRKKSVAIQQVEAIDLVKFFSFRCCYSLSIYLFRVCARLVLLLRLKA